MDVVFSCFGLLDRNRRENPASPEPSSRTEIGKHRDLIDGKGSEFTVLVTGMGGFPRSPGNSDSGHFSEDDNTSHLITRLLPAQLEPFSTYNPTSKNIQILNPTACSGAAVKTEYLFVRQYCKELWEMHGNTVDLIVHLGMADGWEWYSIERSGWKEGTVKGVDYGNGKGSDLVEYYILPDDVNQNFRDIPGPCPWTDKVPDQLWAGPDIDIDKIAKDVCRVLNTELRKVGMEDIEVRSHPDAGNYLWFHLLSEYQHVRM